tara:strand:+ start:132 stop:344 length:213 start_codon:yes stop_codon:yes gene_type:complete
MKNFLPVPCYIRRPKRTAVVRHEINRSQVDAEFIYQSLRELAESHGFVTDHADELLAEVARSMEEYDDYM